MPRETMIRVIDVDGGYHEYPDGLEWETEDVTNNLVVKSASKVGVFAEGQWRCLEQDAPSHGE